MAAARCRASRPPSSISPARRYFRIPVGPAVAGVPDRSNVEPEPASRRWPIVAMFLASLFSPRCPWDFFCDRRGLRLRRTKPGVDETIVDLPRPRRPTYGQPARKHRAAPIAGASVRRHPRLAVAARVGRRRGAQTGSVLIRSTPADADVLVNGTLRGKTPLALRDLALGSYTIRVARDGYAAEERTLQLTARRPTTSTTINLRACRRGERSRDAWRTGRRQASGWTQRAITTGRCARVRQQSARRRRRRSPFLACLRDPQRYASRWMATSRGRPRCASARAIRRECAASLER